MSNLSTPWASPKKVRWTQALSLVFGCMLLLFANGVSAQKKLAEQDLKKLRIIYSATSKPEISFEKFVELNAHVFTNNTQSRDESTLAVSTYCTKIANSWCDTFETGLDQTQYVGAYGTSTDANLYPNPFNNVTYGFSSGVISSSAARQTIVNKTVGTGLDPITNIIPLAPANGGNQSLRLGNSAIGAGFEMLAKTIVVDPNVTILNFSYAVVFEDPNHLFNEQPAFNVRVYDCATGAELPNVCNLGNNSNIVVSDAQNPFFQSLSNGTIAYRNWSQAQINLSAHIGKTVIILFTNKDCSLTGHYGYTYLDNLSSSNCFTPPPPPPQCPNQGDITLNTASSCGAGQICVKYRLPCTIQSNTGTTSIALSIYQSGSLVTTLNSPTLSTYLTDSLYCFSINPGTLGINTSLNGFDYTLNGTFVLGAQTETKIVGNPPAGQVPGQNNDYSVLCTVYYSKSTGDLHNVLTWGLNPDGSGANPSDFNDSTFQLANRPGIYTMTADWTVNGGTVNIPSGSQLQINGFTFSISQLAGAGTISGSNTSNLTVIGTTGGNIGLNFTPASNALNGLAVNRTGTSATATLGNALNVMNVLTLTSGTLNTGGFLTLKSTAANTARVAPVTGGISGNVVVERYIPSRRAWRILSAPVGGSQTINAAWQEGATTSSPNPNPNPGYGTHITEGSAANGLDHNPLVAMMSVKQYSSALNNWVPLANTNATPVNGDAYMLFVRGDRSIPLGLNTVPSNVTTLRATGPLKTGDQTFTVNGSNFTAIPNPFASPINFATLTRSGVQNNFYVWDPKMGGTDGVGAYVLLSDNGMGGYNITPAPVSPESQYIQSGQGFLVAPSVSGTPGTITIKESDKSATAATDVFRVAGGTNSTITNAPRFVDAASGQGLRITLKTKAPDASLPVLDEVLVSYHSLYKAALDNLDAVKMENVQENLGTVHDGQVLMVERKPLPQENDAIDLKLWNTKAQDYMLEVAPAHLAGMGLSAYLEDKYLKTTTPLALDVASQVPFTVTTDPASARSDRFRIIIGAKVLDALTSAPEKSSAITAYPNPLSGQTIMLAFANKAQGMYQVLLTNSSGQVIVRKNVQHPGGTAVHTLALPNKPATGVYRIRITGKDTDTGLSITSN